MPEQKFALFDFDDTLARGDSILPYLLYCIKGGIAPWTVLPASMAAYVRWRIQPTYASQAKQTSLSFIKGRSAQEMDEVARGFFRERLLSRVFAQGVQELERLKKEGYTILIVSASPDVYMRVLPEFLPVETVLSTCCRLDQNGCYTGEVGDNCKGQEKVARLLRYLTDTEQTLDRAASCAYGDSPSDMPMLQMVDQPVLIHPKKKLARLMPDAQKRFWR